MVNLISNLKDAIKNWWLSLIIGLLALFVGVWAMFTPFETFTILTILFVVSFFAEGIMEIIFAISNRKIQSGWGWNITLGVIDIILACILMANMTLAPLVLVFLIAIWVLFRAIWGIAIAIEVKKTRNSGWGWLLTFAILGILLSFVMLVRPVFTIAFSAYFVGFALIFYGLFRVFLASKMRNIHKRIKKLTD